jgi:flavin-binding protein dodecin
MYTMIQVHKRFKSEAEAYRASADTLDAAHQQPVTLNWAASVERETAMQIAKLAHYRCAQEYLQVGGEL